MRYVNLFLALLAVASPAALFAQMQVLPGATLSAVEGLLIIREEGSIHARPDTMYLLMKVQTEATQLGQAMEQNKKSVEGFTAALSQLAIEPSAIRISNFVVTRPAIGRGTSFTRNLIITIADMDRRPAASVEKLTAQVQDLGARYGSQCLTCIGSG